MKTNLTYLQDMAGGNSKVMQEMIEIFIEQIKDIIEGMNRAMEKKDWTNLSKLAHKAKSSVAIMGMGELEGELKILELLAADREEEETYKSRVESFKKDCAIAFEELKNYTTQNK